MAAFEYQAVDGDGKTQKGLIEADTARQARQQLRGMSLMPLEIGEVTSRERAGRARAGAVSSTCQPCRSLPANWQP